MILFLLESKVVPVLIENVETPNQIHEDLYIPLALNTFDTGSNFWIQLIHLHPPALDIIIDEILQSDGSSGMGLSPPTKVIF